MSRKRPSKREAEKGPRSIEMRRLEVQVNTTWDWVAVLRPDLVPERKQQLARAVLDLCAKFQAKPEVEPEKPQITAAQVSEMVWRNSQCIQRSCPMLLFSDRIAIELNAFFSG